MTAAAVGLAGLCLLLSGCGTQASPRYDPTRPHHTPDGFRNLDTDARIGKGFWRWQWARRTAGLPSPPAASHRDWRVTPDLALLHTPAGNPRVTWIGHATVLLWLGGINVLTDPHFTERASPGSLRSRCAADRRLSAALVHAGAARRPVGSDANPPRPRRPPVAGRALGRVRNGRRSTRPGTARSGVLRQAAGLAEDAFFVLRVGETRRLERPPGS